MMKKTILEKGMRQRVMRLDKELDKLGEKAKAGYFPAMVYLGALAGKSTISLNEAAEKYPELAKKFAGQLEGWPYFGRLGMQSSKDAQRFYEKIDLGKRIAGLSENQIDSWPTESRKTILAALRRVSRQKNNNSTTFHQITKGATSSNKVGFAFFVENLAAEVMQLWKKKGTPFRDRAFNVEYLADYYKRIDRLDDLKPENIDKWFKCVEMLLNLDHRGFPELDPKLRNIGIYRQLKGTAKVGTKTAEANIREGIFIRLKSTLKNMVKKTASDDPS